MVNPFYSFILKDSRQNPRFRTLVSYLRKTKLYEDINHEGVVEWDWLMPSYGIPKDSQLYKDLKEAFKEYNNHGL